MSSMRKLLDILTEQEYIHVTDNMFSAYHKLPPDRKVVKSKGGMFAIVPRTDPRTELVPNMEFYQKNKLYTQQLTVLKKQIDQVKREMEREWNKIHFKFVNSIPKNNVDKNRHWDEFDRLRREMEKKYTKTPEYQNLTKQYQNLYAEASTYRKNTPRYFEKGKEPNTEKNRLDEFAPGAGSGEGRWYTDDQMIDIVGPDWAPEDDAGQLTLGQRLQDAQAWLDDQGYSVVVEDVEIDPEGGYRWKIHGEFYNPRFAEKDQGLPEGYELGDKVTWYYSNHYPKIEGTVVGWKDGKFRIKAVSPLPGQEHTDSTIYAVPKNNILNHIKKGMSEGQLNENLNSGIVYATGPKKMGTNDVNLIFKNLNTNKIVAWVVGNNDDGGVYEIRINQNGVKKGPPNFVATGNPQDDSDQHLIYKLGKPGTGRMSAIGSVMQNGFDKKNSTYYGQPLEFVGDDDWWSFLENIIGDIVWEDDAIDAGYVDRLDNGDLVFVKQNLSRDSLNELAPTKFVGNFNRGGGGAGRGGDDDRNERDDSDDEGIINKILQALERLQPDPFETYGGEVEDVVVNLVSSGRLDDYIRAVGMGNIPMKELIKQGVVQTLKELKELYGDQGVEEGQLNELAPNPGGGDGGSRDDGDDGFELPLDFKGQNILVWPRNKKHSMGDTATPFPRGERFTGKVYIMWDGPKIEAIFYLDPKDREDREAEYERVYGPQGRGYEDWLDHKWYDTTGVRYRFVTDWRLIPAKEPGGWPGIVDAWGQDMKGEVMNYPESFITEIIQKDGDGRHFVESKQSVAEGSLNEFDRGESGIGPYKLYKGDNYNMHDIGTFESISAAEKELEIQKDLDADEGVVSYYKIVDRTGEQVGGFDPDDAYNDMRQSRKIQFRKPGDRDVTEAAGTKNPEFSGWIAISYRRESAANKFPANVRSKSGKDLNKPISRDDFDINDVEIDDDDISNELSEYLWDNFRLESGGSGAGKGYSEHFWHLPTLRGFNFALELGKRLLAAESAIKKWFDQHNQSLRKIGLPEYRVSCWGGITSPVWHNNEKSDLIADLDELRSIYKGQAKLGDFWNQGTIGESVNQVVAENDPISMNESLFKVLTRLMIANEQKLSKKRRIR